VLQDTDQGRETLGPEEAQRFITQIIYRMRILIRINLEPFNLCLLAGHYDDYHISNLARLQYSHWIFPIYVDYYQPLLLAAHICGAARVRAQVCAELVVLREHPLNIRILQLVHCLLILDAVFD